MGRTREASSRVIRNTGDRVTPVNDKVPSISGRFHLTASTI